MAAPKEPKEKERRKHWDHRIVHHRYGINGEASYVEWYGIHETFYGDMSVKGGRGRGVSPTQFPNDMTGETVEEVIEYLEQCLRDVTKANRRGVIECTNCGPKTCVRGYEGL